MGETKFTFKRYEKKYLMDEDRYRALWERIGPRMEPDEFPGSTVCSLYYDTEDFRLIRHSIDGPVYKDKLRLRAYGDPGEEDPAFVELKKKFRGVVYKRRVTMPAGQAERWLRGEGRPPEEGQMVREIDWFLRENDLAPRAYIACERRAWRNVEDPELRITFDREIRCRLEDLSICAGTRGEPLLEPGHLLMELKLPEAAPLWLARCLSELEIFPTGYSKYGECYRKRLLPLQFSLLQL